MADKTSKFPTNLRVIEGGAGAGGEETEISPLREPEVQTQVNPGSAPHAPDGSDGPVARLEVGQVVKERYRLEKVIGEGGMGKVFLAIDLLFEQYADSHAQVAIKFLGESFGEHSAASLSLQRETRRSQQLSHPNIVRVLHFDHHGSHAFMVMEFMSGQPLDEYIASQAPTGMDLAQALPIIKGMAEGLGYIHGERIVHADFKPNNVFYTDDGIAKVLDLGISRAWEDENNPASGTRFNAAELGAMTPAYASCEMFEDLPPDPRDDVYALACVTYEILTGHHPFNGTWSIKARSQGLTTQRPAGLSRRQWQALQQGLAFNRADRTATAEEFLDGLSGESFRRRRLVAGLAGSAIITALVAVGLGTVLVQPPDPVDTFLTSLTPATPVALTEQTQQQIDNWLAQGDDYVAVAEEEYRVAGLGGGAHYLLSGGPSNALRAYQEVLSRTDSSHARNGVRNILDLYTSWAATEQQKGSLEDALWTACQGLAIFPGHEPLAAIRNTARTALTARGAATPACEALTGSSLPPSLDQQQSP